jgi:hypothetical protein
MSLKERYRELLVTRLTEGKKAIATLEEGRGVGAGRADEHRKIVDNLRDSGRALEERQDELYRTEGRTWESMRREIEEAVDEWEKAIEEAVARFRVP